MKYKLTDETMTTESGVVLHRIECVDSFRYAKSGDKGGFVESTNNLSQTDDAWVYDDALVYGNAKVFGNAQVFGDAKVCDNAQVFGYTRVYGNALVCDNAKVCNNAKVFGNVQVCGNAQVYRDAIIQNCRDYIVFRNNWSSGRYFTWTRSNDKWKVGCFYGTGQELIEKAYKDSKLSGDCYKAYVELVEKLKQLDAD